MRLTMTTLYESMAMTLYYLCIGIAVAFTLVTMLILSAETWSMVREYLDKRKGK